MANVTMLLYPFHAHYTSRVVLGPTCRRTRRFKGVTRVLNKFPSQKLGARLLVLRRVVVKYRLFASIIINGRACSVCERFARKFAIIFLRFINSQFDMKDMVQSRKGTILREKILFFEEEDSRLRLREDRV